MMCSHTPDTTIPIANPEKPLTKPPKNVATTKGRIRCPSMVLAPQESEQRLHGGTHLTGRLRRPRQGTLDQGLGVRNRDTAKRDFSARRQLPRRLERIRPCHRPGVAEARIVGAVEQLARAQRRVELC